MRKSNDGGAAFPRPLGWNGLTNHEEHAASPSHPGMTLRDYFAAKALQGITSALAAGIRPSDIQELARDCYGIADKLLAEREKGGS